MFSFIRKFFETRRERAVERDRLCNDLLQRVVKVLTDYIDVDKRCKDPIRKWLDDSEKLLPELSESDQYKKASLYERLKQQSKMLYDFRVQASDAIRAISIKEWQKRVDSEQVSMMLNQLSSQQKSRKINAAKPNNLDQKIGKLSSQSTEPIPVENNCSCCGKDGKKKMLYSTEGEALIVAESRSKLIGIPLHVYPCPYGEGFHITSNQN